MLLDAQQAFAAAVPRLIQQAILLGFKVTLGDAYRDPRVHGPLGRKIGYSASNSKHKQRLAIDLNLYRDGQYITSSADHAPLGDFWESIGGIWGGYHDGNHYEWPL